MFSCFNIKKIYIYTGWAAKFRNPQREFKTSLRCFYKRSYYQTQIARMHKCHVANDWGIQWPYGINTQS